jgi:hypothetical protein
VKRSAAVLAVTIVLAGGCVGGSGRAHPSTSAPVVASIVAPPPSPRASSVRLDRLVLTADLGEPPARWDLVTTIPFGTGDDRLGLIDDPARAPFPSFAPSFAVGPDGSLWFLDEVQRRVAHFSAGGVFLGAVGGIFFDRYHPHVQDLAFVGNDLFVLQVIHVLRPPNLLSDASRLPGEGGRWSWERLVAGSRSVIADYLIQGEPTLMAQLHGFADISRGGPAGDALVADDGAATLTPGLPVGAGRWMDLEEATDIGEPNATDQDFVLTLTGPQSTSVQPIHVRVVVHDGTVAKTVEAVVGAEVISVIPDGIVAYIQLSPASSANAARYGGGHWLLKLSTDGSPLWWERLPEPGLSSEVQVRHLAVGSDGAVYRMMAEPQGMAIFRRPTSP